MAAYGRGLLKSHPRADCLYMGSVPDPMLTSRENFTLTFTTRQLHSLPSIVSCYECVDRSHL